MLMFNQYVSALCLGAESVPQGMHLMYTTNTINI